jgi:hypothetical protein
MFLALGLFAFSVRGSISIASGEIVRRLSSFHVRRGVRTFFRVNSPADVECSPLDAA